MDLTRIPVLGTRAPRETDGQWYYHTDLTARAREVRDVLKVYLRIRGQQVNWIVTDRDPDGREYITMTVQEPSGAYRPFDGRALTALRKNFQRGPDLRKIVADLFAREEKKRVADEKRDIEIAEGLADDIKWAGHSVVSSVGWRERTDVPEQLKKPE